MAGKSLDIQLLGETLTRQYRLACELYNTFPVGRTTHQLSHGSLLIDLSAIDHDNLEAICHVLQNKNTPLELKVSIPHAREAGARIVQQAVRGISACVSQSVTLTTLEICNIGLKGNNLETLCQSLAKSRNIKTLTLIGCSLRDSGVERLCQGIKNVPSISNLTLIDCHIFEKGAVTIAGLLKHQRLNRDSAMWQDTLRLRHPHLDGMRGLRRITLNHNPQFGDTGAGALAEVLSEDLWIKAVDLQHCGIGSEGALALKNVLKTNHTIEVLDLRKNPFVPSQLVNEIINRLSERRDEYNISQYVFLDSDSNQNLTKDTSIRQEKPRTLTSSIKKVLQEKPQRHLQGSQTPARKTPSIPDKSGIPWRIEHRLYERREGLKPGSAVVSVLGSSISIPVQTDNVDLPNQKTAAYLRKIKKLLNHYKQMYRKEKESRKHAERKLSNLRARIEKGHMLDEATISHIETCFQKFQEFLMKLKSAGFQWHAGLWEAVSADEPVKETLPGQASLGSPTPMSSVKLSENENPGLMPINIESLPNSNLTVPFFYRKEVPSEGYQDDEALGTVEENMNSGNRTVNLLHSVSKERKGNFGVNLAYQNDGEDMVRELNDDIKIGQNMLSSYSVPDARDESINKYSNRYIPVGINDTMTAEIKITEHRNLLKETENSLTEFDNENMLQETGSDNGSFQEEHQRNSHVLENENLELGTNREPYVKQREDLENHTPNERQVCEIALHAEADINSKDEEAKISASEKSKSFQDHVHSIPNTMKKVLTKPGIERHNDSNDGSCAHTQSSYNAKTKNENASTKGNEIKLLPSYTREENKVKKVEGNDDDIGESALCSQRSETDDEKLQMKRAHIRLTGRSGSISSVSITEQLSHSHSSWTSSKKPTSKQTAVNKPPRGKVGHNKMSVPEYSKEIENGVHIIFPGENFVDYDSDFEVSDVEGLSISASSLTSTTIPDDLVTPGEEEF